jgi:mRNA interferase MazF
VICERYDVVIIPFPFTDRAATKRRPAVALSASRDFGGIIGQTIFAMITQAAHSSWPFDYPINDIESAGLTKGCHVRMKLFTLDNRLVIRRAGCLSAQDQAGVGNAFFALMGVSQS